MSQLAIRAALELHLASLPALATAYEGVPFSPSGGVPFQRVDHLPGSVENPTLGDAMYRVRGSVQVMCCYPHGSGAGAALARAELVRAAFSNGLGLTGPDGTAVRIVGTPGIGAVIEDPDRLNVPVRISWQADVFA